MEANSIAGANLLRIVAPDAFDTDFAGIAAATVAHVFRGAAEGRPAHAVVAAQEAGVDRAAADVRVLPSTAEAFASEGCAGTVRNFIGNEAAAAGEGVATAVDALASVTTRLTAGGFAGGGGAGVAGGAFDGGADAFAVAADAGLAGAIEVALGAFVGGRRHAFGPHVSGNAFVGLTRGEGSVFRRAGNGELAGAGAFDADGFDAVGAAVGSVFDGNAGVVLADLAGFVAGVSAIEGIAAFGFERAAVAVAGHLGRAAADAFLTAAAASLWFRAVATVQGVPAVVGQGTAAQTGGLAGDRWLACALVAHAGKTGAAIGIGATLAGREADAIADELAGGTAEFFAEAISIAAGVIATGGASWAAVGTAGGCAAGTDALAATVDFWIEAGERFWRRGWAAGGVRIAGGAETGERGDRDGGAFQE